MDITLSRSTVERHYPDIVKSRYIREGIGRKSEHIRHSITTQTEETSFYEKKIETKVIPQSTELVKSVEERRNPISLNYSALCTPPYRKKRDENLFASSILASSPLIPRPSVLHANTSSFIRKNETPQYSHSIVVAIDFGTAYSGYAYSFTRDPENVHIMRKWEGDDPGMNNQKTPTILLLTPDKKFHSFGTSARDFYHDLEPLEAKRWFFFDKFKMLLHHNKEIGRFTLVKATNGCSLMALNIFAMTLKYFRDHALRELTDATGRGDISPKEDIRWVITVPAIWRQRAKGFMREAAYEAGIASPENPEGVFIALEPEAASIHCRKLRMNQLMPEINAKDPESSSLSSDFVLEDTSTGGRYMVVDCGGGTVDITVHEITNKEGRLKELFKASGGPYGSITVDEAFERLLDQIFGREFMKNFKLSRPSGFIDLMIAFESRKRSYSSDRPSAINISLPYSFIEFFKNHKTKNTPESIIQNHGDTNVSWNSQGLLRLQPSIFKSFFQHSLEKIIEVGLLLSFTYCI
nr:heat shock 70 kDa protein 12A-like [Lepeophtheirus salmonis]